MLLISSYKVYFTLKKVWNIENYEINRFLLPDHSYLWLSKKQGIFMLHFYNLKILFNNIPAFRIPFEIHAK